MVGSAEEELREEVKRLREDLRENPDRAEKCPERNYGQEDRKKALEGCNLL